MDLKQLIKQRGWTVTRLAGAMGISQPKLSAIIGSPMMQTPARLQQIAEVLKIPTCVLQRDLEGVERIDPISESIQWNTNRIIDAFQAKHRFTDVFLQYNNDPRFMMHVERLADSVFDTDVNRTPDGMAQICMNAIQLVAELATGAPSKLDREIMELLREVKDIKSMMAKSA